MTAELLTAPPIAETIKVWLVEWMAKELEMPADEINTSQSLLDYSLSSMTAMMLVGSLEDWLGLEIVPTLVWDYPTIDDLVAYLAEEVKAAGKGIPNGAAGNGAVPADLDSLSEAEMDALLSQLMN
ncbi:MAG: phosphopantetheine-binding protein [Cyanobacteria bacterium RI_101]|nr:phosphopantetheine-binding protein [Cyanobacteria bacterium RI_101]